jgi:hypothetical protein
VTLCYPATDNMALASDKASFKNACFLAEEASAKATAFS